MLDLYRRGDGLPLDRRARLEAEHAATQRVDPAAFGAAGAAAAAAEVVSDESTRARVVDAAIDCILDEGFYRASSNKIAKRAGVTWGVIQYHFGTREALMLAVHERGLDELDGALADAVIDGDTRRGAARVLRRCAVVVLPASGVPRVHAGRAQPQP